MFILDNYLFLDSFFKISKSSFFVLYKKYAPMKMPIPMGICVNNIDNVV